MYEPYVSLRTFLRFVFFSESEDNPFLAVFLSSALFAGAFEATDAGAFPAVDAG